MSDKNIPQSQPNEPTHPPFMTTRQALVLARQVFSFMLYGTPALETFEPDQLETALVLVDHMLATLQPVPEVRDDA